MLHLSSSQYAVIQSLLSSQKKEYSVNDMVSSYHALNDLPILQSIPPSLIHHNPCNQTQQNHTHFTDC